MTYISVSRNYFLITPNSLHITLTSETVLFDICELMGNLIFVDICNLAAPIETTPGNNFSRVPEGVGHMTNKMSLKCHCVIAVH